MACKLWGAGQKWGDGALWCRQYGSLKYASDPIDLKALHRVSLRVQVSDSTGPFVIDRLSALVEPCYDQPFTYEAFTDVATLSRVSVRIIMTNSTGFVIQNIYPYVSVKKHLPIG